MLKTWARFIRLPNCFTAMADPVAGLAIGTALTQATGLGPARKFLGNLGLTLRDAEFSWPIAGLLAAAGFLIYAAGIIFNDIADLKGDRERRPERALPSGAISVRTAALVALVLAGAGIGCAWWISSQVALVACGLFAAVLLYDFLLKRSVFTAAFGMGLCRALNFSLGLLVPLWALHEAYPNTEMPSDYMQICIAVPVLYLLVIAFLTTLSWTEERFPVRLTPPWAKPPADAATSPAAAAPTPPSTLPARISFWLWVSTLFVLGQVSTHAIPGNALISGPGFTQFVTFVGVFILVYTQFTIFLKAPTRPNLGMTIRNGVLSIPLLWSGLIVGFASRDPAAAQQGFINGYLYVALAVLALYLPLIGVAKWLKTKDA